MDLSPSERLTLAFYNWELRCRGWNEYEKPIDLEPPFYPFLFHRIGTHVDDGKIPGLLERITSLFFPKTKVSDEQEFDEVTPFADEFEESLVSLRIVFPDAYKHSQVNMEQLLVMLSSAKSIISFEIYAQFDLVRYQFVCRESDFRLLLSQLRTFFSDCIIEKVKDIFPSCEESFSYYNFREYGLKEEFMRPIGKGKSGDQFPFSGVLGHLRDIPEGESVFIQVLFKAVINPWAKSVVSSVQDNKGGSFFEDSPELVQLAKEKVASPLFACTVRVALFAASEKDVLTLGQLIESALVKGTSSQYNSLNILPVRSNTHTYSDDLLKRKSHRLGFLVNTSELTSLIHFPNSSIPQLKLEKIESRTKKAPLSVTGSKYVIGINAHNGNEIQVSLSCEKRLRHVHLIGGTGTGKSTLLSSLIKQDIENDDGVCVLDPHGDLIDAILDSIPSHRIKDVIILDPSDQEYPVAFNILKAHSDLEKDILSSDLVATFRKLSTSWGDQMNSVFSNAILAFLESKEGGTLSDLRRFLVDETFRRSFLKNVEDPSVSYYWLKEYPLLKSSSIGPILTRLDTFLRPKLIRHMVSQKDCLDFGHILNENRILLVKLSQGLIGEENCHLLGSVVISKIHQAALGRQLIKHEDRKPFFLYIDEFQNFITPSMESILSGARKFGLGMVLAHQDLTQVQKQSPELYSSLFSNVGTRICFRVGDQDAKKLEDGFSFFNARDLQNLRQGHAIVRSDRSEDDFNVEIRAPEQAVGFQNRDEIIIHSRTTYGTSVLKVEEYIKESFKLKSDDTNEEYIRSRYSNTKKNEVIDTGQTKLGIKDVETENLSVDDSRQNTQHRYIQMLIKKMAEARGFVATLEKQLDNGGKVDVSLENNGILIACEICSTTTKEWELHNIQKCAAAGYHHILSCSSEIKILEKIKKVVSESSDDSLREKVVFLEPAEVVNFLDNIQLEPAKRETRIKGYRVKVNYENISDQNMKNKKEAIAKVVVDSIRKLKNK